jgi:hypothetical protein
MKNHGLFTGLVVCCGSWLAAGCDPGANKNESRAEPAQTAAAAQLEAIVKPTLDSCRSTSTGRVEETRGIDKSKVIPAEARRSFPKDRIAKTLHGIWRGEVAGDQSDVHVDYFWIMDTKLNEALIVAQRSGKNTVGQSRLKNAPKLTYLMCAHEGYSPATSVPQIHQFTKVSHSTDSAAQLVQQATGLRSRTERPTPSELWRGLVESKYFDGLPYVAFAGALFKPLRIEHVRSAGNTPPEVVLGWDAEYRGGGSTKLKYTTGVPMRGTERGQFVGTTTGSGDYLVSSPGNGGVYKVEVFAGGNYDLGFDSVILEMMPGQ